MTVDAWRPLLADLPFIRPPDHESLLLIKVAQEAPSQLPSGTSQRSHLCDQQDPSSLQGTPRINLTKPLYFMKKEGHPEYHSVVFVDVSTAREFPTRSTMKSKETKVIDGVEHFVIRREVTMDSHPAYTGEKRFVDSAGRVEKFNSKFKRAAK